MLVVSAPDTGVLLERRPGSGRWGGLWSFPEFQDRESALTWAAGHFGTDSHNRDLAPFRHTFSHFHFDVQPMLVRLATSHPAVMEAGRLVWYNGGRPPGGFPRPVSKLLTDLEFPWQTTCTA